MNKPCEYCQNIPQEHLVQYHYHTEFVSVMCEAVHRVAYLAMDTKSIRGLLFPRHTVRIREGNGQVHGPQSSLGPVIEFSFDKLNNIIVEIHDREVHSIYIQHWHDLVREISLKEGISVTHVEGPNPVVNRYWRKMIRGGGILPPMKAYKAAIERPTKENHLQINESNIRAGNIHCSSVQHIHQWLEGHQPYENMFLPHPPQSA
jgi:hypothetical protein